MARRRRGSAGARAGRPHAWRRRLRFAGVAAAGFIGIAGAYAALGGHCEEIVGNLGVLSDDAVRALGFTVQDVTVTGRHFTKAQEILAALGVARGDPITALDTEAARDRMVALDWVREASVMRLYPDTIHVNVEEHQPLAIWQDGDTTTVIDDRGIAVEGLDVKSFPHLPLVVGPGADVAAPAFLAALEDRPAIADRIHAAVRVGERRWTLRLDTGVEVLLPEQGMEVALDELIRIDERTNLIGRDITLIDMRLPDRLTVLPAAAGKDDSDEDKGAAAFAVAGRTNT